MASARRRLPRIDLELRFWILVIIAFITSGVLMDLFQGLLWTWVPATRKRPPDAHVEIFFRRPSSR